MGIKKKHQKEFEEYLSEQVKIMHGHFSRIMLRLINKMSELQGKK